MALPLYLCVYIASCLPPEALELTTTTRSSTGTRTATYEPNHLRYSHDSVCTPYFLFAHVLDCVRLWLVDDPKNNKLPGTGYPCANAVRSACGSRSDSRRAATQPYGQLPCAPIHVELYKNIHGPRSRRNESSSIAMTSWSDKRALLVINQLADLAYDIALWQ
jgi:hypothetical protein